MPQKRDVYKRQAPKVGVATPLKMYAGFCRTPLDSAIGIPILMNSCSYAVSYTHLAVYKRPQQIVEALESKGFRPRLIQAHL